MNARTNPIWIRPEGTLHARELETQYDLAYDNPGYGMAWNLSPKETAGVIAVGFGLTWATTKLVQALGTGGTVAALGGGTLLYTLGVVIGTNRPSGGWIKG